MNVFHVVIGQNSKDGITCDFKCLYVKKKYLVIILITFYSGKRFSIQYKFRSTLLLLGA